MALSTDLLLDGEHLVISVRTHIKILFARFGLALLIAVAGGAIALLLGSDRGGWWVALATFVVIVVVVLPPLLRWLFSTYSLTDVRLIEQEGIFSRSGRIIPLSRVNDVAFEKSLTDRMLGCGTLIVHDASEQQGLRLIDIPHIESFHRTISTLVLKAHGEDVGPGIRGGASARKTPDGDV